MDKDIVGFYEGGKDDLIQEYGEYISSLMEGGQYDQIEDWKTWLKIEYTRWLMSPK